MTKAELTVISYSDVNLIKFNANYYVGYKSVDY